MSGWWTKVWPGRLARGVDNALVGLAFVLPISIAVSNALWAVCAVLWLALLALDPSRRNYRWTGLEVPWLALLALGVVSALVSENPARGFRGVHSEMLAVVFVLAAQAGHPGGVGRRWTAFAMGAVVAGLTGVLQQALSAGLAPAGVLPDWALEGPYLVRKVLFARQGRSFGFFSHPITYAEVLLPAFFLCLALAMSPERRRWWVWAGACAACLAGIAASQTRGVWLALLGGLALWTLIRRDKKIFLALALVCVTAGVAVTVSPALRSRAASVTDTRVNTSNLIRLGLWRRSVELIGEHPVIGVGPKNIRIMPDQLRWGGSPPNTVWTESHNMYLQMAVERGLPALAVFVWFLWAVGRRLWRISGSDPPVRGIFYGFMGLLLAGLTETWTNDSEVMMTFYFLVGSACALGRERAD